MSNRFLPCVVYNSPYNSPSHRAVDYGSAEHKRASTMPSQGSLFTNFEEVQVRSHLWQSNILSSSILVSHLNVCFSFLKILKRTKKNIMFISSYWEFWTNYINKCKYKIYNVKTKYTCNVWKYIVISSPEKLKIYTWRMYYRSCVVGIFWENCGFNNIYMHQFRN